MFRRSFSTMSWMPGYCTFTATSRPSQPSAVSQLPSFRLHVPIAGRFSRARCTCASDAAAIGFSSNSANTSSSGRSSCALDAPLDHLERPRRHLVLQPRQHADVLVRDQVRPRANDLPELDQQPLPPNRQVV